MKGAKGKVLGHDLEYQEHARYECHGCKGVTSHKRTEIKQMENQKGGVSSVFVMKCRVCEDEDLVPAAKFDNGALNSFLVRK